jgi:hypothetical protein
MATITKTPSGTWKAVIRKVGWPTASKTFRTKRDAEDWSRRTEDEMVRGVYIQRTPSERMTIREALARYEKEIVPTKRESTQRREGCRTREINAYFGDYSLAAVTPDLVARFRDMRLGAGKSNNTVRLELALLGHLFTVAIKEWHIGLTYNPVANIRKPSPGEGRDRRLTPAEQESLLAAADAHSNPMLGWIIRIAIETGMRHSEILNLRRSPGHARQFALPHDGQLAVEFNPAAPRLYWPSPDFFLSQSNSIFSRPISPYRRSGELCSSTGFGPRLLSNSEAARA